MFQTDVENVLHGLNHVKTGKSGFQNTIKSFEFDRINILVQYF